ncbi:TRAP transporter large permease [Alloyangia pacifica]|uniref:TRAP transporter large permease protein n=1 Tax=Alloyangia pacifica TaxID=311180 RepID=A0A1I6VVY8_9RHOB|nr:TRAP transporter large permease [Alloyangia pacifica]SDI23314.1 TRAP transporter, DctM subunit [Alloyangia pacifica]SFT17880.1 TRAP transporter, DctM subunit [Alloyangia pacifica]
MSSLLIGGIGVAALFGGILLGINVMVVLGLVGAFGLASLVGFKAATAILGTVFFDTTHSFHFSVIPLFLLMGFFAMRAGLGEDLFEATTKWLGNLRGGLAISTTLGAAAFGAASGSSVGTATVFTKLALPQMLDRGYDKSLASASIAIAGTLAVMIPPSALVVVYGILTDSSIGALLIAGFIPGIVFALVLCLAIWLTVLRNPSLAPQESYSFTLREKFASLKLAGPLVLIILLIVVGLYVGIFTPTEAGGIGAFATFLLAIIRHRGIKGVELRKTLLETIQTSAMIFGILICALVFSKFLALSGVANAVGGYLTGLDVNRWVIVLLVSLIYLALGMMMDAPALLAITLPITHPVMMNLGFDPIWFGIFVVLLVEIGAVTPPVGINCFVVQSASNGRVSLEQVFKGLLPFVLAGFAMLILLCLIPQIALFLPETML